MMRWPSRGRKRCALLLRPYGDAMLTPAVAVWLGFAWVLILLMATLEGVVWGLIGATLVPADSAWLKPLVGGFMLLLIFAIIWIVDASLIMSERPLLRARRWHLGPHQGAWALLRWLLGFLVRLAIVGISLYVTAPFLAKLIRADDIAAYHERQIAAQQAAQAREREAANARTRERVADLYEARAQPLVAAIARLEQSLQQERDRLAAIEAEHAPEIAVLRTDLAAAQRRTGDELLGRDGRPEGRGPEARKWEAHAARLAAELAAAQGARDDRTRPQRERIGALELALREQSAALQAVRAEQQAETAQILAATAGRHQTSATPPLTFSARAQALVALRESPEEREVPHLERVEGFAQAALGVLFLALIALKLFEPPPVRRYFNETLQIQYVKYRAGGLRDIPGFEPPREPALWLNAAEFARLWEAYERDPAAFYADRQALIEVREPLDQYLAAHQFERERLAQRRDNLIQEAALARQRRARELAAYDRELSLRTQQLQAQLANETKALQEHRRLALATELAKTRETWQQQRAAEEAELEQRRAELAYQEQKLRAELQLREKEIARLREQSLAEVRQAEVARQLTHQHKLAVLEAKRQRELFQGRLNGVREELSRLRGLQTKLRAERQTLTETSRKLDDAWQAARQRVAAGMQEVAALRARAEALRPPASGDLGTGEDRKGEAQTAKAPGQVRRLRDLWPGAARDDARTARTRKLLGKEEQEANERLAKLREALELAELRRDNCQSERRDLDNRIAGLDTRIDLYEDNLAMLLSERTGEPLAEHRGERSSASLPESSDDSTGEPRSAPTEEPTNGSLLEQRSSGTG